MSYFVTTFLTYLNILPLYQNFVWWGSSFGRFKEFSKFGRQTKNLSCTGSEREQVLYGTGKTGLNFCQNF